MQSAPLPINEDLRLKELHSLDILDTEDEADFDELVRLASYICQCDISLMSLVDKHRQWFKAKRGIAEKETTRDIAFCAHAILQKEVFVVEDALKDSRFHNNPLVNDGTVRFYAGAPIQSENDLTLGTICVIDSKPRHLTEDQIAALAGLARQAAIMIELKNKNKLLKKSVVEQQVLKEKAEKASKAKEQFLSTMSHEIRTPLNGVIGLIHLLALNSPRHDQVQDIDFLKTSSENLLHIVNDILDFNKIESGNLKIEKTEFSLHELISGIEKIHLLKARQKSVQLNFIIDPAIPDVLMGDGVRIKQVLNNLTDNAIKFTEKGSVQLDVGLYDNASDKLSVSFKIKDTGIGINAEHESNIYDRFFQANSASTRSYGGTGLGLAISKKLLELMNSEIHLKSLIGEGSCFSFVVGFDKINHETSGASSHTVSANAEEGKLNNLNVLVVEDNKMNKMLVEKFLRKWKINPDFAVNGAEAIDQVSKKDFDLILMDLQMPVMDGYEATKYIRNELKSHTPIIALTADAFFNFNNIAEYGLTDYVLKPFNPQNLYNKIYRYTVGLKAKAV